MKRKIRRRCICGCGGIANPRRLWIKGHHRKNKKHSKETKKKMSLSQEGNTNALGHKLSKKMKRKISLALKGNKLSNATKLKISLTRKGMKFSKEHKKNISLSKIGNVNGKGNKGKKMPKESKLKMSLSRIKCNPNYSYCDVWKDREYKSDIRKDYCENKDCKKISNFLINHHIYLNKKRCSPNEIMTLCNSCHPILHQKLREEYNKSANPKDYIIINRPGHVSYIHKASREVIKIIKRQEN